MTIFPTGLRVPSGHRPPVEIVAATLTAIVVLPVPGAPARICNRLSASHSRQSQRIAIGAIESADSNSMLTDLAGVGTRSRRAALVSRGVAPHCVSAAPLPELLEVVVRRRRPGSPAYRPSGRLLPKQAKTIVVASVEAGKPSIPALKRPDVKPAGIATFPSRAVEAEKEPRRAPSRNSLGHRWRRSATSS